MGNALTVCPSQKWIRVVKQLSCGDLPAGSCQAKAISCECKGIRLRPSIPCATPDGATGWLLASFHMKASFKITGSPAADDVVNIVKKAYFDYMGRRFTEIKKLINLCSTEKKGSGGRKPSVSWATPAKHSDGLSVRWLTWYDSTQFEGKIELAKTLRKHMCKTFGHDVTVEMTPQLQKEFDKAIADFPYVIKEASDVSVAKIGGDQGYCSDYIYLPPEGGGWYPDAINHDLTAQEECAMRCKEAYNTMRCFTTNAGGAYSGVEYKAGGCCCSAGLCSARKDEKWATAWEISTEKPVLVYKVELKPKHSLCGGAQATIYVKVTVGAQQRYPIEPYATTTYANCKKDKLDEEKCQKAQKQACKKSKLYRTKELEHMGKEEYYFQTAKEKYAKGKGKLHTKQAFVYDSEETEPDPHPFESFCSSNTQNMSSSGEVVAAWGVVTRFKIAGTSKMMTMKEACQTTCGKIKTSDGVGEIKSCSVGENFCKAVEEGHNDQNQQDICQPDADSAMCKAKKASGWCGDKLLGVPFKYGKPTTEICQILTKSIQADKKAAMEQAVREAIAEFRFEAATRIVLGQ